ncbi:MAG: histone deacetylase [Hyphomicrobiaceae bacterium]|nr:histone deacetylase [Hyphomicrobiaceae bacterium]
MTRAARQTEGAFRSGGDVNAARFFYPDTPDIPVPDGHRFPAMKYRQLLERVRDEAILPPEMMAPSPIADRGLLAVVHCPDYVANALAGRLDERAMKRIGIPWSEAFMLRARATVGGTLAAARAALRCGYGGQLAGGTHHAHHAHGAGFCMFNDTAIAARVLIGEAAVHRVAILDLDVHQGDGTARLLAGDPAVMTVSVHGAHNYPFTKELSDLDIALPDGTDDAAYLEALHVAVAALMRFQPDLVLYISGADALAQDRLGRLALTLQGLQARDEVVFRFCREQRLPVAVVIGGGYAEPIGISVAGYANTFRALRTVFGF